MRIVLYVSGLVVLASYAFLSWTLLTVLLPEAGGLWPFDLRALGYGPHEAGDYLVALSDHGRAVMAGAYRSADTVLPVALGLYLAALAVRQGPGRLALLGALTAAAYAGVDLAENAAVARLIAGPVDPDPLIVSGASVLTMAKFAAIALTLLLILMARLTRRR